jgi:hypothetical protein
MLAGFDPFMPISDDGLISKSEAAILLEVTPARISQLLPHFELYGEGKHAKLRYGDVIKFRDSGAIRRQTKSFRSGKRPASSAPPAQEKPVKSKKYLNDYTELDDFLNGDETPVERLRIGVEFEKYRKLQVERLAVEEKYVSIDDVTPTWSRTMAAINRNVMGIPSRLKADNPELALDVVDQIERLCREALHNAAGELSQDGD